MDDYDSEMSKFWAKVTAVHCDSHSVDYAYSVPDCADFAMIMVCEGASRKGYWCPSKNKGLKKIFDLPLTGTQLIQVNKHKEADTLFAVALGADADPSQCRAAESLNIKFLNFTNCRGFSTTPETNDEMSDSNHQFITTRGNIETTGINYQFTTTGGDKEANGIIHLFTPKERDNETTGNDHQFITNEVANSTQSYPHYLQTGSSEFNLVIGFLISFFIVALVCLLLFYIYKKYSFSVTSKNVKKSYETVALFRDYKSQKFVAQIASTKTPIVYVVFLEDSPPHKNVVIAFANYLQEDLGFRVIFELWETQKASENYSTWMQNAMESADKIILVWSDGASEKVRTFKENNCDSPDTFSPVVQHMQNDLFKYKDVTKYSLVYFSYSDKESIPTAIFNKKQFLCFELMRDFEELYFRLMDIEKHQPGLMHHFPKADVRTLFNSNVTKNGPILKQAIKNASKQNTLLQIETESIKSTSTDADRNLNFASYTTEITFLADLVDAHANERSKSLPSLTPLAETFKSRTLSLASMESNPEQSNPEQLLHEINYLTKRQEFIYSQSLLPHQQGQRCVYHHT